MPWRDRKWPWSRKREGEFRAYLERLLRDEKRHIDLLSGYVGYIQMIR